MVAHTSKSLWPYQIELHCINLMIFSKTNEYAIKTIRNSLVPKTTLDSLQHLQFVLLRDTQYSYIYENINLGCAIEIGVAHSG